MPLARLARGDFDEWHDPPPPANRRQRGGPVGYPGLSDRRPAAPGSNLTRRPESPKSIEAVAPSTRLASLGGKLRKSAEKDQAPLIVSNPDSLRINVRPAFSPAGDPRAKTSWRREVSGNFSATEAAFMHVWRYPQIAADSYRKISGF